MEPDFSGWATKNNLKCSDGRTIMPGAFKHSDGMTVPLVWQHQYGEPANILGHAKLENRAEGVYAHGFFNDTENGQYAKSLVQHKDITALSIFANNLTEQGKNVLHGDIKEVSLVLSGANPGASIDFVNLSHSDDGFDSEAVIYTGLELEHADNSSKGDTVPAAAPAGEKTIADIFDTLSEEQRKAVEFVVSEALNSVSTDGTAQHSDLEVQTESEGNAEEASEESGEESQSEESSESSETEAAESESGESGESASTESGESSENSDTNLQHSQEGTSMPRNVFEQNGASATAERPTLSHSDLQSIVTNAQKLGSFKEAFLEHAATYGIENIDYLFPDAVNVTSEPDFISRRTEWVQAVLSGAKHSPFSRIKSTHADITAEEARAKGYVKGNLKKDEIFKLLKRVTTPTTVYKKQKLDRDDIIDITDLDVVAWLKNEMRLMLDEEIARAILIGDGRQVDDPDKINEDNLRPIAWDDEMYAHSITVPSNTTPDGIVESVLRARKFYKGTGTPTFYTTDDILTDLILIKDKIGRRLYQTEADLAAALRVDKIVTVEVMEDATEILGIIVNIADYTIGADKGGQVSMFDDFDIDYNQFKYLMEGRISGALTKPKSALVIKQTTGTVVTPQVPAFDPATNTITVPNQTGVEYWDVTDILSETQLTPGAVVITKTTDVEARPAAGYSFPHNTDADWTFAYTA